MRNDGDKMEENARRLVLRFHRHIRRVCKSVRRILAMKVNRGVLKLEG